MSKTRPGVLSGRTSASTEERGERSFRTTALPIVSASDSHWICWLKVRVSTQSRFGLTTIAAISERSVLSFESDRGPMHDTVRDNGYRVRRSWRGSVLDVSQVANRAQLAGKKGDLPRSGLI